MEEFEDLLLSITEPIDKERNKPIKSQIQAQPKNEQVFISDLTEEQEEKLFYQKMSSLFTPEKSMKQIRIKGVDYLDLVGKKYIIRRPYNEPNWAIYDKGNFLVRIKMIRKNKYLFKVEQNTFSCLNLSDEMTSVLKKALSKNGEYCKFNLNYENACAILDDFNNISKSKRNNLLSEEEKEIEIINTEELEINKKTLESIKFGDSLTNLGLSKEIVVSLNKAGVYTRDDLSKLGWGDLDKISGLSRSSIREIMAIKKANQLVRK